MKGSLVFFQHEVKVIRKDSNVKIIRGPRISSERPMEVRIEPELEKEWAEKTCYRYQMMVERQFNDRLYHESLKAVDDNNYEVMWILNRS